MGQSIAVTGGTGALGSLVGSWAAALGASHVSLLARSAHAAEAHPAVLAGVRHISVVICDVAIQADVSAWLATCAANCALPEHILQASTIPAPLSLLVSTSTSPFHRVRIYLERIVADL